MGGDRGGADIEGDPENGVPKTRPHGGDRFAIADRQRHRVPPDTERRLEISQGGGGDFELLVVPLIPQGRGQTLGIPRHPVERGGLDLHVHQAHDRVDREVVDLWPLADHLSVDHGVGRHLDHHVIEGSGSACQPAALGERLAPAIGRLGLGAGREAVLAVVDAGEAADLHLTSAADTAAGADRVEIDADSPCGIEDHGSGWDRGPPPRRGEDDLDVGHLNCRRGDGGSAAVCLRPPRPARDSP